MFEVARKSTIRMVVDELEKIGTDTTYYEWDGYAEATVLPSTDLVGLIGFSLTQDGKFHNIVCGLGLVTYNDTDIERLTKLVDHFYNRLSATSRYPIFTPDGTQIGMATCFDGTTVAPAAQVDVRPAQTLSFTARLVLGGE